MTENTEGRKGCLTKSLQDFLMIPVEQRESKYGKNTTTKYYQRIVETIQQSFQDHLIAWFHLPCEISDKIQFRFYYEKIMEELIRTKLKGKDPFTVFDDAKTHLKIVQESINNPEIKALSQNDFEKVSKWLDLITNYKLGELKKQEF